MTQSRNNRPEGESARGSRGQRTRFCRRAPQRAVETRGGSALAGDGASPSGPARRAGASAISSEDEEPPEDRAQGARRLPPDRARASGGWSAASEIVATEDADAPA